MLYYCFITLLKEKQYERTRKVKGNRIETLFRRHKGCGHRYADGCAAKHGILLDQKRNSKRNVTFEFKRLSYSKAKVWAARKDHSNFKIRPLRRHRPLQERLAAIEQMVSDITYFHFSNKTYYLCAIIDLYARKVVAWRLSERNSTHLTKGTLKLAI